MWVVILLVKISTDISTLNYAIRMASAVRFRVNKILTAFLIPKVFRIVQKCLFVTVPFIMVFLLT